MRAEAGFSRHLNFRLFQQYLRTAAIDHRQIGLFDLGHRLACHADEGENVLFEGHCLGRVIPAFHSVPIALWSAAVRAVHPTDPTPIPPARGTVARSNSTSRRHLGL